MARCGRCGLWNKYPDNHHEQKYAGVCVWYQMRLSDDEVWEDRKCPDFFERIPGLHVMDHFEYKCKRDNLGDAFREAHSARLMSWISLGVALGALISEWLRSM